MIATQACQNKRRHSFSGVYGKPAIRKKRKPVLQSDSFSNTLVPTIGEP